MLFVRNLHLRGDLCALACRPTNRSCVSVDSGLRHSISVMLRTYSNRTKNLHLALVSST